MSRADDLAAVFAGLADNGPAAVGFRQALVVAFNQGTGEGVYNLAGAILTNLPLVSSSESLEIQAGDSVVLMRLGSSFAVLGRVVTPNSANRLATSAVAFDANSQGTTNFAITTFSGTPGANVKTTATLTVPSWANQAAILASAICVGKQPTTPVPAGSVMTTQVLIDGATDPQKPQGYVSTADNHVVLTYPSLSRVLTVAGGATITVTAEMWASGNWGTNSSNYCRLHALAMFRRA